MRYIREYIVGHMKVKSVYRDGRIILRINIFKFIVTNYVQIIRPSPLNCFQIKINPQIIYLRKAFNGELSTPYLQ